MNVKFDLETPETPDQKAEGKCLGLRGFNLRLKVGKNDGFIFKNIGWMMVDSRIQDAAKNQMGVMMADAAMRVEAAEHNSKSLGFMRCCTLRII